MIGRGGSLIAATGAMALGLGLALAPVPAQAQSANDWRLPGATVRPAPPGSQGPVDRDNPVVTTTTQRPAPAPDPTQAPQPTPSASQTAPAASATPSRNPVQRQIAPAPRQAGAASGPSAPPPANSPAPAAAGPALQPAATGTGPAVLPTQAMAPPPTSSAPPADPASSGWYWPWIAAAAALLALVFAGLWWRRSRAPEELEIDFERPLVAEPKAAATPLPSAAPAVASPPLPEPQLSLGLPAGLGIALDVRRMNASLMATTLSYVITLTNTGTELLTALAVEGDMVSAHASLPPEAQIANDNQRLELRHALVELLPGESATFSGDFRLPLTAVTPIRAGEAAYFVPLARLRIEASTAAGGSLIQSQTYVVGELPEAPGAALKPFRLDLGPRTYSRVGQRAVN